MIIYQWVIIVQSILFGLALWTGCASQRALTKPVRESLQSVSINKDVKLPDDMFYYGTEQVGAGMFGLIGAVASAAAAKGPKAQLKAAMQEGQIDVAQIVREQFATQLVESHVFSSIIPEGGEAEIRLEVRQFGFATQFGSWGLPAAYAQAHGQPGAHGWHCPLAERRLSNKRG